MHELLDENYSPDPAVENIEVLVRDAGEEERKLSLLERRTLRGVKAYTSAPTRSGNPPMPVPVLNRFVSLIWVTNVF